MKMKTFFLIWMAALCSGMLRADTLSYTVTPGGTDLYQFTLSNTGTTGGTLFDLFVALPTDISNVLTSTIGTPTGWGDPTGGLLSFGPNQSPSTSFVEWTADFNGAYNIPIGNSLAGFSFETLQPITGPVQFALNDSTTLQTAVQESAVPEPSMLSMLLFGGLAVSVRGLRGRRKFRTSAGFRPGKAQQTGSPETVRVEPLFTAPDALLVSGASVTFKPELARPCSRFP